MADDSVIAARVRELFDYDPLTGVFTWKIRSARRTKVGSAAGYLQASGYRYIKIDGAMYQAHRLAWLYVYGRWPTQDIDHANGSRDDNRIANLRDVPRRINNENLRRPSVVNQSGYLGVDRYFSKWRACIKVNGRSRHIGLFDTPELAHEAYVQAKRKFHEGCTL